jgi:hypothetical protein
MRKVMSDITLIDHLHADFLPLMQDEKMQQMGHESH